MSDEENMGRFGTPGDYGGLRDDFGSPWSPVADRAIDYVPPAPTAFYSQPHQVFTVEKVRDLSDAERRGLAKLLPFIEAALDHGEKLDRDQIAAFVLLQSFVEGT